MENTQVVRKNFYHTPIGYIHMSILTPYYVGFPAHPLHQILRLEEISLERKYINCIWD
jgi:hypothetical protein